MCSCSLTLEVLDEEGAAHARERNPSKHMEMKQKTPRGAQLSSHYHQPWFACLLHTASYHIRSCPPRAQVKFKRRRLVRPGAPKAHDPRKP
jgi:hypothetical protein